MIRLGVAATFFEIIEISDEEIAEYLEENPDATLDEIKESYVQSMIDNKHYWDSSDIRYEEIQEVEDECSMPYDLYKTYTNAINKGAIFNARCFNIPKEEITNEITPFILLYMKNRMR